MFTSYILTSVSAALISGKLEDCLVKEDHILTNTKDQLFPSTEVLTPEACAITCSEEEDCTAFSMTGIRCAMFKRAEIRENQRNTRPNISSGICPKSKKTLQENNIEDIPNTAPNFQCSEEEPTKLCHFPFLYNGEFQWDSLRDQNDQCKCSLVEKEPNVDKDELINHSSMETLDNCKPCSSGSCPISQYHYSGFALRSYNGRSDYKKVSLEECKTLCQKTRGCLFLNHDDNSKTCWLKWGVGKKSPKSSLINFCPKNCPIDCTYSWGDWSNCNATCGEGVETQRKIFEQPLFGGKECEADKVQQTRPCSDPLEKCPENANIAIGILLPTVTLVLLVGGLLFFVKKRKVMEGGSLDIKKIKHTTLKKDDQLNDKIADFADNSSLLNEEFKTLEIYVKEHVDDTMIEAKHENNRAHNRYKDIVPYDGKFITLKEPSGDPPTDYINATLIKFDGIKQTFIATQAPKPNSFQNFWQMVIEKKVKVIVMITGLLEGNKRKADQYWPDEENRVNDLMDGVKLEYKETSYQGTYYHRTIKIILPNGTTSEVSQLQTTKWLDLTAPEDTNILLDLVNKTRELVDIQSDTPVVVHCSAGVGRTGTFIAVYKLIIDYFNQKVKVLDPFQTVFEMRQQRMKMVQKPPQYAYVVKCVTHVVKEEEGAYYEN